MTIAEWMTIAAVLLAPLTAVQVQKWLEGWREKKERKKHIFTILCDRCNTYRPITCYSSQYDLFGV